jgi:hypothetical protein
MPWARIRQLLGPGLHWSRTQEELRAAIARAEQLNRPDVVAHLRIILELRNAVMMDPAPQKDPADRITDRRD